jgi:hypothetical protein
LQPRSATGSSPQARPSSHGGPIRCFEQCVGPTVAKRLRAGWTSVARLDVSRIAGISPVSATQGRSTPEMRQPSKNRISLAVDCLRIRHRCRYQKVGANPYHRRGTVQTHGATLVTDQPDGASKRVPKKRRPKDQLRRENDGLNRART